MTVPADGERVAVYTALYGGYDQLVTPVPQDVDVDWICFTDDPSVAIDGWTVIVRPGEVDDPRLASKWAKCVPHLALPEHRWTIWVDANMAVDAAGFVREALSHVDQHGIAVFRHPQRDCIYDEAEACLRLPRCRTMPVLEQVASYRASGYPAHAGLYACGTIARDAEVAAVRRLGARWWEECQRWTARDQLSFPFVAREVGVTPAVFPHHLHRHVGLDALACLVHRSHAVERLLARRPAPDVGASPSTTGRPLPWLVRATTGSNPWYAIETHATERG
jgi:hypothetical protein